MQVRVLPTMSLLFDKLYTHDNLLSARESHATSGFFEGPCSVKQREARILSKKIRDVGQVSQVTDHLPPGLVYWVNGCDNSDTTNKLSVV